MTPPAPVNPVLVLDNGIRVPMDLRYYEWQPVHGHIWKPIIEGDLEKILPRVVAIDADSWTPGTTIRLPGWSGGTPEWAERILANSPNLKSAGLRTWATS